MCLPRRLLLALGAVLGAALLAVAGAGRVERPADDVVADARQVLDTAAPDEDDRVLLQVVTDARDVRRHLDAVAQPDAGDLAQRRVGLLRCGGVDAHAHPPALGRAPERRRLRLLDRRLAADANQLLNGGHGFSLSVLFLLPAGIGRLETSGEYTRTRERVWMREPERH